MNFLVSLVSYHCTKKRVLKQACNPFNPTSHTLSNASQAIWGAFFDFLKLFNELGKVNFFSSVSFDFEVGIEVFHLGSVKRPHPFMADRVKVLVNK